MNLNDKLNDILNIIAEIKTEEPGVAAILLEGIGFSVNLIEAAANLKPVEEIELGEQIEIVTDVLGFSLPDLVTHILQQQQSGAMNSDKEVDQETLNFITADLDDYEKFLAQTKAKDDIDFLSKTI